MSDEAPAPKTTEAKLELAIETADRLQQEVTRLSREIRANRLWRWWAIIAVTVTAVLIAVVVFVVTSFNDFDTLLERSHAQGVANHTQGAATQQLLETIQNATSPAAQANTTMLIDRAVCEIRDNAAEVLHDAFPKIVLVVPSSATCPAFTP